MTVRELVNQFDYDSVAFGKSCFITTAPRPHQSGKYNDANIGFRMDYDVVICTGQIRLTTALNPNPFGFNVYATSKGK